MTYRAYDINGYTFYTIQQDKKSIYQNSGVRIDAYDNNMQKAPYYGQIEEIWELNYLEFKVALFKCRWVQESQGVTRDKNGLSALIFAMLGTKQNPLFWQKMCCKCFMSGELVACQHKIKFGNWPDWCVLPQGQQLKTWQILGFRTLFSNCAFTDKPLHEKSSFSAKWNPKPILEYTPRHGYPLVVVLGFAEYFCTRTSPLLFF